MSFNFPFETIFYCRLSEKVFWVVLKIFSLVSSHKYIINFEFFKTLIVSFLGLKL